MSFGEQLSAVRRRSGLPQEQFAEQLQVSRQAVSKWESGRGYPEIEKILYICNRYQVSGGAGPGAVRRTGRIRAACRGGAAPAQGEPAQCVFRVPHQPVPEKQVDGRGCAAGRRRPQRPHRPVPERRKHGYVYHYLDRCHRHLRRG